MSAARRVFGLAALVLLAACAQDDPTTASTTTASTTTAPPQTSNVVDTTEAPTIDTSDFLLGGEFSANKYKPLFLNLLGCTPGNHTQFFGLGSTTFKVDGIESEQCIFSHGTEIENPEWDGAMSHSCTIDRQRIIELIISDEGINLETFGDSCVEI